MNLAALQRDFGVWLQAGAIPDFGPRAMPGLHVYRNNYRAQLAACLETSFAHTLAWIGGDAFHAAVVAHVERVPPSSWTLDAYPRDFPDTLGRLHPADPEIAELADLERALDEAFVGADAAPITAAAAASVDWDHAALRFTPTLDLLRATTNAAAIHAALTAAEAPPPAEMLPDAATILVWRHDRISCFRTLDPGEARALLRVRAGSSFAALCASAVAAHGEADGIALAGGWLGRWLADGLIVDIFTGDAGCAHSPHS